MNNELHVWMYLPGALEPVHCGTLELVGGRMCRFSYATSWLELDEAFALSPDLPLRPGAFEPPVGQDIGPIFEDAGPDRWGRPIIERVFNPRRRSEIDYLALVGEDRIGALAFSSSSETYSPAADQVLHRADLPALLAAAQAIERREEIGEEMRRLLRPGTSAGGARPKAIIEDAGRRWIAKFPADGDTVDVCAIEHASLRLAQVCDIAVPDSRLVTVRGQNVLLVERFDRDTDGSRHHFCSARTACLADGIPIEQAAYSDIANFARRYSATPTADAREVFRRMVFNVLMENTDDHEKNHAFLWKNGRWNLAPAYDLQPQLQGIDYQALRVGDKGHEPTLENVMSACGRFMLTEHEARDIVSAMLVTLARWEIAFAEAGVDARDIEQCGPFVRVAREAEAWSEATRSARRSRSRV
ncbi:type II toxin-antitoxin system HipA family toxin [Pararobbsia silviterrae]|uniref:Type II toxin-antitoxin system HipA family toxin n=1 Tax=Pararobbsia silviterrae TaxID=1792498 RepID=A0A494XSV3_9BURK|nr:type II toxin-antitoxin system HipA family toxin [Pararobbsia silviterrae]RKP53722.1 type II toxin-antitoxin system HipA family toxin [Pararobbsia silviterrae]